VDAFVVEQLQRVRPNGPATRTITPKTVNNYLTVLTAMLNCAVEIGWLAKAPKIKKLRVRILGKDFRYLRTDDEIRRFLIAAKEEGESVFALYATAVYTGMRAGELAGLHWDDVSFDRRLITVQRSFTGPTKAEDVRYVPILDALLPVLRAWRLRCAGHLVFQNQRGGMLGPSGRIFQEMLHRVLERAGLPRRYITFHGARHTFASHWMMNSGDLFKLQKILGHKSVQMTLRYAHLAPDAYAGDYHRLGAGHVGSSEIARIAPNARSAGAVH
jgi:integrase